MYGCRRPRSYFIATHINGANVEVQRHIQVLARSTYDLRHSRPNAYSVSKITKKHNNKITIWLATSLMSNYCRKYSNKPCYSVIIDCYCCRVFNRLYPIMREICVAQANSSRYRIQDTANELHSHRRQGVDPRMCLCVAIDNVIYYPKTRVCIKGF